ncbi:SRPBCC family protein [Cellulomonas carbonis]|uniref:ATPase n=1 Tax=Cellulomonas carbonis T26 TaxID=947969 RepID=A0A0A0BVH3_9CELL|nr:SRPBCC family protein [Cellulomonas carbonis]KGM11672.1 ATPase [Cellulomonas carbonis T26]GGB99069.1 ATPase [Cellulomonas carbonis]
MAVDVRTEVLIARPREEVAAFAADPDNAPRWYVSIDEVRWRTEPPLRVGTRLDFVARFLGRRLAYTYEVRELVQGERLVMSTADGPFPMETTYTWSSPEPGTTLMTLRNRGRPARAFGVVTPLMARAVRSANRKDLANLRRVLEA